MNEVKHLTSEEEWKTAFPAILSLRPALTIDDFLVARAFCIEGGYRLFGLKSYEKIVCIAGISVRPHISGKRQLEIEDFATHPEHKRSGYGRELVEWIINYARSEECFRIKLNSALHRQDAHLFYKAIGFSETGCRFEMIL